MSSPIARHNLDWFLAKCSPLSQIANLLFDLFQFATQNFPVPRILRPLQLLSDARSHQRQALQLASTFCFLFREDVFLFGGCDCVSGFALLLFN
jgi:hypothetical protein